MLARETVPTTTPDETLGALGGIASALAVGARLRERLALRASGRSISTRSSPAFGHITSTPKPGWRGADVLGRIAARGRVPAAFDTDVNGAALAEMRWGSGRGFDDFAYVTVGTGVGVGLIVNGAPTRGFAHCELGHIRVRAAAPATTSPDHAPSTAIASKGLAAGPSLEARVGASGIERLGPDDPVWQSVAWAIAQLCHAIVCAAAPRAIAIGGGVIENGSRICSPAIERMLVDSLTGYMQLARRRSLHPRAGARR